MNVFARANANYYTITQQNAQQLEILFEFDSLSLRPVTGEQPHLVVPEIRGLLSHLQQGEPVIPIISLPIVLPPGKVILQTEILESENYSGLHPPILTEFSTTEEIEPHNQKMEPFRGQFPVEWIQLRDAGLFRDYRLTTLRVYPVQVSESGIAFIKRFRVRIRLPQIAAPVAGSGSEVQLLQKFVINKQQAAFIPPINTVASSPPAAPEATSFQQQIRIIVNEPGIYKITGQDLLNAGIDPAQIDMQRLRLTNKGTEVAFYFVGGEDGTFDESDYFEFWGEPNVRTFQDKYPDMYKDPFTDENVYWLSWGHRAGVRMVEESGSVTVTNPTQYNPAPFFSQTIHVEEDTYFERMGYGNLDHLSHTRDLWFYGDGIKAVGKKQFPFELEYPDSSSFINPVVVTAMFAGQSFGGNPHNVMVWLNNRMVGQSRPGWYDQDTARITNRGSSTISNFDLHDGTNILEVQLPQMPASGTDIVLLNWFEVTYDRQYRTRRNYLEFTRPSITYYPIISRYQFELVGFTRPDISIYKKGISKIVNFNLLSEVKGGKQLYKVIFQDDILNENIEYVALTENMKKKPLRIEPDEPFDEDKPDFSLRDTRNSADYIIITHNRFYREAKNLRDYRRQQGLDVELVRVQDIYDEFNHGIKSPLAIKDFLRYAFFNWNKAHRLKYVLLLGDANFDYKATTPTGQDFVPTFFYQTYKFGAASTDYPYSLLSGNDQIPDVFVGRLPVATVSDVQNVINKIIEYEQQAPVGPWRNQALFISGNDRATFEFGKSTRPLFRTQNSRVLEVLLPDYVSAFRLNTVKDPNLDFDPNFGGTTDLIEYFDDGLFYLNFMGHGGGAIWADVNLFNLQDVERLNNKGMYPFVTSMTCFTGAFENPGNMGLAQKLVLTPDRGAIGVLASSGLGWAYNDYAILWAVDQFVFDRSLRIGEAITLGKILYISNSSGYFVNDSLQYTPGYGFLFNEMVHQYNFIGDPYIKLAEAVPNLEVEVSDPVPQAGDTLNVTIRTPIVPSEGYLDLTDHKNQIVNRLPLFLNQSPASIPLTVPDDFPEGNGLVRAYVSDGLQDGCGFRSIGVNYAVIDSLKLIPEHPDADDSVHIQLFVQDRNGIERVYILLQNQWDTLYTQSIGPNAYQTLRPIPPTNALKTVLFTVYIENTAGNVSVFRNQKYVVTDTRADLFLYPNSISFTGNQNVQLKVSIGNNGTTAVQNATVHFYDGYQQFLQRQPFATGTVSLAGNDSLNIVVDFPLELTRSSYRLYAWIDPDGVIPDFNRNNNVDSTLLHPTIFNVTPELGSTLTGSSTDTLALDGKVRLIFLPGAVSQPTAVRLQRIQIQPPQNQKGLVPVPIWRADQLHSVALQFLNPATQVTGTAHLFIQLEPDFIAGGIDSLLNVRLYHRDKSGSSWISLPAQVDSSTLILQAAIQEAGEFAPFVSRDRREPRIELTVDGRPIRNRSQVSTQPTMYVVIEDEGGLSLAREQVKLLIDDQPLPENKIFIPDSLPNNNILGITLYPTLEIGQHRLKVQVRDVNGNLAEKEYDLLVSEGFDLHVFGNYPNPFSDETIISYYITNPAGPVDEFEVRIYTVSGMLIKKITEDVNTITQPFGARSVGYNEIIWDGTDNDGIEVANGVYFALIRAKFEGETKEKIIKIAKLK